MTQPQVAIALTADDKTARGLNSAEKRTAATVRRIGRGSEAQTSSLARGTRGLLGTVVKMEQATSKLFGGGSLTGGVSSKLGAIGEAAGVARTGMLGAAEAGGLFEGALVGVAGAAAITVGTVAAVAAGMYKLAVGWGKGANQLGNLSSLIGVSTKGLQEFAGAAERVGVSKDVATGAIGSVSQTLNDARYGRNNAALAVLGKMGVKLQTNQDGTVNVEAMLPALANALQGQNSSGRRTAARALGITEAALAAFTQGGSKLSAGMADYGRNGAMMSDDDTKLGRSLTERDVALEQRAGKVWLQAQRTNATVVKGAGDAIAQGADAVSKMTPPSLISAAYAQGLPPAGSADGVGGATGSGFGRRSSRIHGAGRFSARQIADMARRGMPLVGEARSAGFDNTSDAVAVAASVQLESQGRTHSVEGGGGGGRGLLQWTDRRRKDAFRRAEGVDVEHADRATQWRHIRWETQHTEAENWRRAHANGTDAESVAAGYTAHVVRPHEIARDSAERAAVAQAMVINLEFTGLPTGTGVTATAKSSHGSKPAISHAFNHR